MTKQSNQQITENNKPEQITEQITNEITEQISEILTEISKQIIDQTIQIIQSTENEYKKSTSIINNEKLESSIIEKNTDKTEIKKNNNSCSNDEIINNKCGNITIEVEQIKELFNQIASSIKSFDINEDGMKLIKTENVVIQITTLDSQEMGLNPNVSYVNIGECETKLRTIYNISESKSLIMIKSDSKTSEDSPTNVLFDLYHPDTKNKLNMSYCNDVQIKLDVPTKLEITTIDLYDSLLESGYNLFDPNDTFYNDVCSVYTSTNGTDMT